jgi:plastocyanin
MVFGWTGAMAFGGTITGMVHAEGKPGADQGAQNGNYASREFKFVERVNYADMRDFVVYIDGPMSNAPAAAPARPIEVTTIKVAQRRATFFPHVQPVMVGSTVEWPNKDDIYHNVFSYSEAKSFDLGLYKDTDTPKSVTFDKPGEVDVFCSIHANMSCIVLVVQNPYFAVSDERGAYTITNVPPGAYRLKAWHERLPSQVREITVPESGGVKADFTLGITGLPKQ